LETQDAQIMVITNTDPNQIDLFDEDNSGSKLPRAHYGMHAHADRGRDLYETPACATRALLKVERLPSLIWEPAAGRGAIVKVLRENGHTVIASDLIDYGFPLDFVGDFLKQTQAPNGAAAICTNFPFQAIEACIAHALDLVPTVITLGRLAMLESRRCTEILEHSGLARVHIHRERLPMMHRDGWAGKKANSAVPYAWFTWVRGYIGPILVDRISLAKEERP
jgi:hypothetical protein